MSGHSLEGGGGAERRFLRAFTEFQSQKDKNLDVNLVINESLFLSAKKLSLLNKEDNVSIYKEKNFLDHLFFTFFIINLIKNGPSTLHLVLIQKRLYLLYLFLKYFRKKIDVKVVGTIASYLFAYRINLKISDKIIYKLFISCLDKIDSLYFQIQINKKFTTTPCPSVDYGKFQPKDKKNSVVFAGRLIKDKNPMLFLEAVNILLNEKKDKQASSWKFYVLGDGPLKTDLRNYVEGNNLSNNVYFVSGDTSRFLGNSKIFVSLQEQENYPSQSLLEAISCENIIIATDVGDTRRLFKNSNSAIFIQPTKETLAKALEETIKNPEQLVEKAKKTRIEIMAKNTLANFIQYLETIWLND